MKPEYEDQIRSAFRKQASKISTHLDVESSLEEVRGPMSKRQHQARSSDRRGFPLLLGGVGGPAVALVGGFTFVLLLIGVVGLFAPRLIRSDGGPIAVDPPNTIATEGLLVRPSTDSTPEATGQREWMDGRYQIVPTEGATSVAVLARPAASDQVLAELAVPHTVVLTGEAAAEGGMLFYEVVLDDRTGWIDAAQLAPPEAWSTGFDVLPCEPDGAAYETTDAVMPASNGPHQGAAAGHILDVLYYPSKDCERLVIVLGGGAGRDGQSRWIGTPAAWVPEGTEVHSGSSVVSVIAPELAEIRPMAATLLLGKSLGLASRSPDGIVLNFLFDANRRAAVQILENPARIVIDLRAAPTGTGLDLAEKRGGQFVVMPIQTDVGGEGVLLPVTVNGWGRPNEATAVAELRRPAAEPGTGEPVEALFDSAPSGPQRTSRYVFATADWVLWGEFSFTIDDLPTGDYELFIGEYTPSEGNPGVYLPFSVAG